jgi:tetratricopeptide (TPR) repeat protein
MRMFRRPLLLLAGLALLLGLSTSLAACWYRSTRPENRLEQGRDALRRGDWERAERLALLLDAAGAADRALLLRAEICFEHARPSLDADQREPAVPWLRRALEMCNQIRTQGAVRLEAAALTGKCLLFLGAPAQAERAFAFVLHESPDHADPHRSLAAIYYDQGALLHAEYHLKEVARLDPQDGRPYRMLGDINKRLDRHAQAIDCFREALRRTLSRAHAEDAREELTECLLRRRLYVEALQVLDEADAVSEPSPRRVAWRAECLRARGETAEAQALLDRARADHPAEAEILRVRARLHEDAHEWRAAADLFGRVVTLDSHDYAARYQLALAYEHLGRAEQAAEQRRLAEQTKNDLMEMERQVQEALSNPWDAPTRRRLAELCRKLGQPELARVWFRAAEACGPRQ